MRTFALFIFFVFSCYVLAGCSKQREISGEIFTRDFKKGIVKQSGTVVHFLTPSEREQFEALMKDWRDRQYKDDRELWDKSYKEYSELFEKHKREDGKVYISDTGNEVMEKLKALQSSISAAKARIEEKAYDREISFDDQTIKQFLATAHRVAADADGKFKVILSTGKEYWVLADGDVPPFRQWYFRYFPDGMPLILSDGNSN